jgi:hypothetical protein
MLYFVLCEFYLSRRFYSWVLVARTWNSSYSGGKDQGDGGLKPARQIVLKTLSQKKKPITKRAGGVAQGVGHEFEHQYQKKKKKDFANKQTPNHCCQ